MTSPLQRISDWYTNQPDKELKVDLAFLSGQFLPDVDEDALLDPDGKIADVFASYLSDRSLSNKEVAQRAFFVKALIEGTLTTRGTAEEWDKVKTTHETIRDNNPDETGIRLYNQFMSTYEQRKAAWIAWANEWQQQVNRYLIGRGIHNWYHSNR